jgi:hypothetical protein
VRLRLFAKADTIGTRLKGLFFAAERHTYLPNRNFIPKSWIVIGFPKIEEFSKKLNQIEGSAWTVKDISRRLLIKQVQINYRH